MPTRSRFQISVLAALVLLAAACTDTSGATTSPAPVATAATTTAAASTTSTTTAAPVAEVDRLVIITADGNVATMDRDGGSIEVLTDDAGAGLGYFQPTWSPDAQSIVVSRLDSGAFTLLNFDLAAGTQAELPTQNNAFYVYWSPRGDRVGFLSNGAAGLELAIAEFGDDPTAAVIDTGAPFYFSWSPDGEQIATLIGQQRLDVRDAAAGSETTQVAPPGAFLNPAWTDVGLFYVSRIAGVDQLVVGTPGGDVEVLARSPAPVWFTVPPSGERIAVQAAGDPDGVAASFQEAPALPLNRLVVIDTATGELTEITEGRALAFFWDRAGEQLLILDQNVAAQLLRWSVWSDGTLHHLVDFLPAQLFVQTFLPFFSQYALSTTMWSPDGTAFAFAGFVDGRGGIYVQDVTGGPPRFIAEGRWVMWSPR